MTDARLKNVANMAEDDARELVKPEAEIEMKQTRRKIKLATLAGQAPVCLENENTKYFGQNTRSVTTLKTLLNCMFGSVNTCYFVLEKLVSANISSNTTT